MTISQVAGAGAYARASGLGYAIPVRPIDPIRQRPQVKDDVAAGKAKDQSAAGQADERSDTFSTGDATPRGSRGGFALLGAVTSFLASLFSQAAPATTTTVQAGIQAYARSAGALPADEAGGVEVMSPSFPRLASGRAVDLSI